jgi:hypothetical protein
VIRALLALAGAAAAAVGLGYGTRRLGAAIDDAFDFPLDAPAGPARRYPMEGPAW